MLTMFRTDAGLVRQVLGGHSRSFDELVRRHLAMSYGIAFSYTRNHSDAEDLSQEALLKAFLSLDSLREPKKFGQWLSVITRNLALRYSQKIRRERDAAERSAVQAPTQNTAAYDDMRELLEEQIGELNAIPREVLTLHYFSGKTTREIASTLGLSQAAVLKRLQRAREALGAKLIAELSITSQDDGTLAKGRSTIMKSIGAPGFVWKISSASWQGVFAQTLFSGKGIAATVLCAGLVAVYLALNPPMSTPPDSSPDTVVELATTGAVGEPESDPMTAEPEKIALIAVESTPEVTGDVLPDIDAEVPAEVAPDGPLAGKWFMYIYMGEERFPKLQGSISFAEEEGSLVVKGGNHICI